MDSGLEKRHIPDRPGPDALKGKENSNKSLTKAFFSGQLNEILGLGPPLRKRRKKWVRGKTTSFPRLRVSRKVRDNPKVKGFLTKEGWLPILRYQDPNKPLMAFRGKENLLGILIETIPNLLGRDLEERGHTSTSLKPLLGSPLLKPLHRALSGCHYRRDCAKNCPLFWFRFPGVCYP